MQQHLVAGQQRAEAVEIEPGGGVYLGNRSRFVQRHAFRHRQHVAGIDHHFLGHAASGQQGADAVAHLPAATSVHLGDHAGTLQAKDVGHACGRRVMAGALQQIRPVQPSGRHLDADLPLATCGSGPLGPLQMPLDTLQCLHAASIVVLIYVHPTDRSLASSDHPVPSGSCFPPPDGKTEPAPTLDGLICIIPLPYVAPKP